MNIEGKRRRRKSVKKRSDTNKHRRTQERSPPQPYTRENRCDAAFWSEEGLGGLAVQELASLAEPSAFDQIEWGSPRT